MFIDEALVRGQSVLVHCLAGAHRAGTTGCLCLMHYEHLNPTPAIAAARARRSIIDPIDRLPELLDWYQAMRDATGSTVCTSGEDSAAPMGSAIEVSPTAHSSSSF